MFRKEDAKHISANCLQRDGNINQLEFGRMMCHTCRGLRDSVSLVHEVMGLILAWSYKKEPLRWIDWY